MSNIIILPDSAVETPGGTWAPTGAATRLLAIQDQVAAYVLQDGNGATLTVGFDSVPSDATMITGVSIVGDLISFSDENYLNCELFVDGVSKGVKTLETGDLIPFSFNLAAWDGPWTPAQANLITCVFEVDTAGKNGIVIIVWASLSLTYSTTNRIIEPTRLLIPESY